METKSSMKRNATVNATKATLASTVSLNSVQVITVRRMVPAFSKQMHQFASVHLDGKANFVKHTILVVNLNVSTVAAAC